MRINRLFKMANKMQRKILLMYITKVSGHRQATVAIQQSLKQLDPSVEAPAVNGFGYTYPVLEKVVHNTYMRVIKSTPKVWDYIYDNPKIVKNSQSIKNFLHKTSHEKVAKLFERYQPDTVVCTQAFPCGMIADFKRANKLDTKLIGVLTDFEPHSFWINKGVNYYIVPTLEGKERFMKKGVPEDMIKVYGIPLRMKFAMQLNKRPIALKLDLDPDIPTILIMGGGQGLGPIKAIVKSLIKVNLNIQIIVISGKNKKIINSLNRKAKRTKKRINIYEFANNVDELMEVSDLIITKPGGMTTAESLAKGLPMIIVDPIPGQEMRNTDFLIKKGIGIRVDDIDEIGEEVELLLRSPERLNAMRKEAYANSKPHASLDIAKLILGQNDGQMEAHLTSSEELENYV